ncbi:hypothetical protein MCHI_001156 [Candidatus Magnetoovum chiemensis]|nr:hypothetical protein MCHI_001156 [Candidatus Magnetoovum chiemensis]
MLTFILFECSIIMAGVCVILFIDNRRLKSNRTREKRAFRRFLERKATKLKQDCASKKDGKTQEDSEVYLEESINITRLNFFKTSMNILDGREPFGVILLIKVFNGLDKMFKEQLTKLRLSGLIGSRDSDHDDAVTKSEFSKLQDFMSEQKQQNITLIGYRETVSEILQKFRFVLSFYKRLCDTLETSPAALEKFRKTVEELRLNTEELEMFIKMLERENDTLDKKVKEFKTKFHA